MADAAPKLLAEAKFRRSAIKCMQAALRMCYPAPKRALLGFAVGMTLTRQSIRITSNLDNSREIGATVFKYLIGICATSGIAVMSYTRRCVVRLVVWILAILAAALPTLYAADSVVPMWQPDQIIEKVVAAGLFRDFFYVTTIIAIIGLSNVLYTFVSSEYIHIWLKVAMLIMIAVFVVFLMTGIAEFSLLAKMTDGKVLPPDKVQSDITCLRYAAAFGIATEFLLALRNL